MKQLLFIATLFFCITVMAQVRTMRNYPVLANAHIKGKDAATIDANSLAKAEAVWFSVTIMNTNGAEPVKAGTCILNIELGEQTRLAEWAGRSRLPLTNYINWTVIKEESGATRLTGKLIADLPADFAEPALFELQCAETGHSSIKTYWTMPGEKAGNGNGSMSIIDVTVKKKKSNN